MPILGGAARGEGLDLVGISLIVAGVSSLTYGIVQIESLGLVAVAVWAPAVTGAIFLIRYGLWLEDAGTPPSTWPYSKTGLMLSAATAAIAIGIPANRPALSNPPKFEH